MQAYLDSAHRLKCEVTFPKFLKGYDRLSILEKKSVSKKKWILRKTCLTRQISASGRNVDVQVYRGAGSDCFSEVAGDFDNSTVWRDQSKRDREALDDAKSTIKNEEIESLIGLPS